MNNRYEYDIKNYWNDEDDLYVQYTVYDNEKKLSANAINYFNTSDIGCDYNNSYEKEILDNLHNLIKQNNGIEFRLPKVSKLNPLLKYVYDFVCESDSNMCHIDEDDWYDLSIQNNYTNEDLDKLKNEIKKYHLEDYITLNSDGYKICGYGGLQCCFNDDREEREVKYER